MKAQSLKNAILQLAVQGRLVPQDKNDEPASELLKRIAIEKKQLIKNKKIKSEKSLPEILDAEKPFDIPENWEWVRLGELGDIIGGGTPKTQNNNYWQNGNIPWLTPADMSQIQGKLVDRGNRMITTEGLIKSSARLLPKNSIIYSSRAPIGYIGITTNELCTNQGFKSLVPINNEIVEYLYYSLIQKTPEIQSRASGTTFKEISGLEFALTVLSLPPLAEQQRIVAKIEQLMPLIDKYDIYEQELSALEKKFPQDLKKSILKFAVQGKLVAQKKDDEPASMLLKRIEIEKKQLIKDKKIKVEKPLPKISEEEKLFDIPNSWEWVRLGEIGSWGSGATPSRANPAYYNGNIPWLKTGDLNDSYIIEIPESITELALKQTSVRMNDVGSVLIAMYGATIGKIGILTFPATTNQACCSCTVFTAINNKYLFYYLLSQREEFKHKSEGGAQPNISKEKILAFTFPLPPLAEQQRIVSKVESLMTLCEILTDESKIMKFELTAKLGRIINFTNKPTEEYELEHLIAARAEAIKPETQQKQQERIALMRKKK